MVDMVGRLHCALEALVSELANMRGGCFFILPARAAQTGTLVAWGGNNYGQSTVPTGLSGVVAIAAGYNHNLALKSDGTVVAWGDNRYGKSTVPTGLSGVVAVAGGSDHSLALKNVGTIGAWGYDGEGEINVPTGLSGVAAIIASGEHNLALKSNRTVVAWGYDISGATEVPVGLTGVVAIAAGEVHSLALKSDGTVVSWGRFGQSTVPAGLNGVVAIAGGGEHSLALKSDGTVVAWGDNSEGESTVPAGLSGVVAIAAGYYHSLALKSDGTVIAWGDSSSGQSTVPAGLRGVLAIAAGEAHSLALVGPSGGVPVTITVPPQSQIVNAGATVSFSVTATGTGQLSYQWRFNGANITGATSSTLALNSVGAGNNGAISVVVWNAINSVVSATASLAVLTDGANGNNPTQSSVPAAPPQPAGVNNLVLVTHGWEPLGPFADVSWITDMANAIQAKAPNWTVFPFNWLGAAWFPDPDLTLVSGAALGTLYAKLRLEPQHWQHIHFIAHSAGSAVIEAMAKELKSSPNPPEIIQETFLDPYTGYNLTGREIYGVNADWADDYFVVDYETDFLPVAGGWAPGSTSGQLEWAYNVDVGGTLQAQTSIPFFVGSGVAGSTPAYVATSPSPSHGSPIDFYMSTINGTANSCATGYGFPLSIEDGGSGAWTSHPLNNPPLPLCGTASLSQNQQPVRLDAPFIFSVTPYDTSTSGVNFLGSGGATLTSDAPAWLAVGVTVTNAVNFVQFDAGFTDTNAAQGLLTAYWNTNQVGMVDERVASASLQTYRFALPSTVTSGLYTLSFRLDSFTNSSSIAVTNVGTGFVGVTQPITLGISRTNGAPLVQLTAATNFTYLIQSSTNLVDWTPTALLLNTNGTAQFIDLAVTNSNPRFYRAVMP